jgi:membrane-associated protease RseP (regulator of RpoE activity)
VFVLSAVLVLSAAPVLAAAGVRFGPPVQSKTDSVADSSRPARGWLGVVSENISPAVRLALGIDHGVVVSSVVDSSPAALAGLKVGDVITEVDGEQIDDATALRHAVRSRPERSVALQVVRRGSAQRLTARLGSRQSAAFRVFGPEQFELDDLEPLGDFLRAVRPHALLEGGAGSELDSLRVQLQALRQELQELRDQLRSQSRGN